MEEKSLSSSMRSSSSEETVSEDFNWIDDENFLSSNKKDYLKYPLSDWRESSYIPILDKSQTHLASEGKLYEMKVRKILRDDVFKGFHFIYEKDGLVEFDFMKNYEVNPNDIGKRSIEPDFFVHKMEVAKFNELLKNRSYMIRTFQSLKPDVKYVSIIGEIKIGHKRAFKMDDQRKAYTSFIDKATLKEGEKLLLMYVYDQSYKLFKEDVPNELDSVFLIICYIPKIYRNNCYKAYNDTIEYLNLDSHQKIDLNKVPGKRLTKNELIKKIEKMDKEIEKKDKEIEKKDKEIIFIKTVGYIGVSIGVLIIALFLYYLYHKTK